MTSNRTSNGDRRKEIHFSKIVVISFFDDEKHVGYKKKKKNNSVQSIHKLHYSTDTFYAIVDGGKKYKYILKNGRTKIKKFYQL